MSEEKKKSAKNKDKYVAYVSTYTMGDNHGIKIYDVNMDTGRFAEKDEVEISNSSYITVSHNGKYLYSITDLGVESYRIAADGTLDLINFAPINGMRGCYLSTDYEDKYLFVAGYHDAKVTVLRINDDGSAGDITNMDPEFVQPPEQSVKMAVIVVSTVPIMCVYPFLQKYFVKGVMVGALKG